MSRSSTNVTKLEPKHENCRDCVFFGLGSALYQAVSSIFIHPCVQKSVRKINTDCKCLLRALQSNPAQSLHPPKTTGRDTLNAQRDQNAKQLIVLGPGRFEATLKPIC